MVKKPTLEQFGDAVDLAAQTLQELDVSFSFRNLREVAEQLRGTHRSQEISMVIEPDVAVFAKSGLVHAFDSSVKNWHIKKTRVHPDIDETVLRAERHPFGRGFPLRKGSLIVAQVFGIPAPNGRAPVHGHNKWLDEQLDTVQAGLNAGVIPMSLSAYIFEQAQRREQGSKPLDTKTMTRFPQCYVYEAFSIRGARISPYAYWDAKKGQLAIDRSNTHPHAHVHYRSMVGLKPTD